MRLTALLRPIVLALLLAGTLASPALPVPGTAIVADDDDDRGEEHDDDDDGNRGHGNDDDRDDDDNPGRGNDKDKPASDKGVTAVAEYRVEVACEPDDAGTTCTFTTITPEGAKEASQLLVPASILCTGVVETEAEYVDPDPNLQETGYKSRDEKGIVTLRFDSTVTAGGTATYWLKAADRVYPATGPGLACEAAASSGSLELIPASPPAATEAPATGTVLVEVYACTGVTAGSTDVDWFGACAADPAEHRFLLSAVGDATTPLLAASTGDAGEATFEDLGPGPYHLDDADARWCHAESDNVNPDGNVVVEAGATTTVWLFYCGEGGA